MNETKGLPIPTDLPPWATPVETVCITAKCSGCGEAVTSFEDSGTAHFESLADALESLVSKDPEDDDPDYLVVGDELLCRECHWKRECERLGHDWLHHEPYTSQFDGRAIPEWWSCPRCGEASKTDPTALARDDEKE